MYVAGGVGNTRMGVQEAWLLTCWPHPFRPIQSYCLKVKEMDDEEYSCIVSTEGPLPAALRRAVRDAGHVSHPGGLAGLYFLEFEAVSLFCLGVPASWP